MSNLRTSLTLGHAKVDPRPWSRVHPSSDIGPYAGVDITDDLVVTGLHVEQLLDISTAFADAALALQRLQDQVAAEQTQAVTA